MRNQPGRTNLISFTLRVLVVSARLKGPNRFPKLLRCQAQRRFCGREVKIGPHLAVNHRSVHSPLQGYLLFGARARPRIEELKSSRSLSPYRWGACVRADEAC